MILPGPDGFTGFEDVREMEAQARRSHAEYISLRKQAIQLIDGILQLESSAGYKPFQKTLSDMLEARTAELLSAREDRPSAIAQGRCIELRGILELMKQARDRRQDLANEIKAMEDSLLELERNFKPSPGAPTNEQEH